MPPPANPQPTANGMAMNSPATSAGTPTSTPTVAPAYGPAIRPAEKGAFERQVGGVVVEQQPGRDAGHQRHAEREREYETVGPAAALEDQDVPEPAEPGEHRRQHRHDRQLDDQRRQQQLIGREEDRLLEHALHCTQSCPSTPNRGMPAGHRPSRLAARAWSWAARQL